MTGRQAGSRKTDFEKCSRDNGCKLIEVNEHRANFCCNWTCTVYLLRGLQEMGLARADVVVPSLVTPTRGETVDDTLRNGSFMVSITGRV